MRSNVQGCGDVPEVGSAEISGLQNGGQFRRQRPVRQHPLNRCYQLGLKVKSLPGKDCSQLGFQQVCGQQARIVMQPAGNSRALGFVEGHRDQSGCVDVGGAQRPLSARKRSRTPGRASAARKRHPGAEAGTRAPRRLRSSSRTSSATRSTCGSRVFARLSPKASVTTQLSDARRAASTHLASASTGSLSSLSVHQRILRTSVQKCAIGVEGGR